MPTGQSAVAVRTPRDIYTDARATDRQHEIRSGELRRLQSGRGALKDKQELARFIERIKH